MIFFKLLHLWLYICVSIANKVINGLKNHEISFCSVNLFSTLLVLRQFLRFFPLKYIRHALVYGYIVYMDMYETVRNFTKFNRFENSL